MTPKKRYLAILNGQQPDCLPRIPILMQFAAEHIGSNYGAFASDHRVLVEAGIRCAEEFGIDQLSAISDPYRETSGFGASIRFEPDSVPICVKPPLQDDPDLTMLAEPDPLVAPRMRDRIEAIRAYKERTGDHYSIMGWIEGPAAEAADLRGVSNFLIDLMDDETYADALMGRCVETAIRFAKAQVDAGADTIGVGDAIASQVSKAVYDKLILPHEKTLVAALHAMNVRVRLHICGNIGRLLPSIATLEIDIIDIDHMVSLNAARTALGPRVVLAGNVDPVEGIMRGTPETIAAAVAACHAQAGDAFMVCAGCEIPAATPKENLAAFCRAVPPHQR
jgi:MtaA/CmuA family methyltransferase